ncbi:concanavalin A-like lectin/glucanase [Neocallimastix californiae]|uniref:endo-1,4-beta-xylanase n=1 Tax=Neocallimastix californiae TaxID=1754190 RepID=A0A1Y2F0Q8_9FUNG|nr:concanavalin A-like lectin/glucanase [Neocallimastix californiae]|eukprot:ORY77074.1 concanavalin A-like lectin/glucanase [Neocallimastix californiae]
MKSFKLLQLVLATTTCVVNAQSFCSSSSHSGQSVKETSNKVGTIGDVGYEIWSDSGNNSATFYSDGSFSCTFQNAKDYLCRSGLSFDSTKTHTEIGHMYADFKLVKQSISNVDYSYVGIYGWTKEPLVEYYIVDNWLSQYRPGDWVGNKKHGDFTIDGAQYTVYENTRTGPSIVGDTTFKQYFSIRQTARDCGTIDITAHFEQWEKLGMKMGKMHEAKVLGEAGSTGSGTSGTADFPYAKVYLGNGGSSNTGSKTLPGGVASKTLPGGAASKTLPGGAASKTLPGKTLPGGAASKTLPSGAAASKTLPGKTLPGGAASKTLPGGAASKTLPGGAASKTLPGKTLPSGAASKTLPGKTLPGGAASKTLPGGAASKTLPGGAASKTLPGKTLPGGAASKTLPGGAASKTLPGGAASKTLPGKTLPGGAASKTLPGKTLPGGAASKTLPGDSSRRCSFQNSSR